MQVSGTMTEGVICVTRNTTLLEAERIMQQIGIHHLPVFDEGMVQGILSDRDIKAAHQISPNWQILHVSEVMTSPVEVVSPDTDVVSVLEIMIQKRINAVVVGKPNDLYGIITSFDLLVALQNILRSDSKGKTPALDELSIKLGLGRVADFLSQIGI